MYRSKMGAGGSGKWWNKEGGTLNGDTWEGLWQVGEQTYTVALTLGWLRFVRLVNCKEDEMQ